MTSLAARAEAIRADFAGRYGHTPAFVIAAPGRVNLIGEHTDYNGGFVLPMAIERATLIAAAPANGNRCRAYSINLDQDDSFQLDAGALQSAGGWTDYIRGVAIQFLRRGMAPVGLDLLVDTDVPIGCGLSSSAALQVGMAHVLRVLSPDTVADSEVAALCQAAEHEFTGMPSGIMDQFCIHHARDGHLVHLDCRSLETDHVPFDEPDVAVLIVDSRAARELRTGAYAQRRAQCEAACETLGVDLLRDATPAQVEAARDSLGDVNYRRARHIVTENERVGALVAAVRNRDWAAAGEQMYRSHRSMAQDFEISCPELDTLVELARKQGPGAGVHGARMTGGGFGGCIVALVSRARADDIVAAIAPAYRDATGLALRAYVSSPSEGAHLVEP